MDMHDKPFFTEALLLERLGPAPTVSRVSRFLDENPSTTWRRLNEGKLKQIDGIGTVRISLKSLASYLNGERPHEATYRRGKLPGQKKPMPRKSTTAT